MAQKKKKGNHDIVYGLQKHFKPCTGGTRIFNMLNLAFEKKVNFKLFWENSRFLFLHK